MKKAPYAGDCEDYSLTLLYNLKGRSLYKMLISILIRESKICHCKVKGNGHAVLKYKGRYNTRQYTKDTVNEIIQLIFKAAETLFDLEFVSTEFTIGDFRLDSLCFNNETNSFIIVEYNLTLIKKN